MTFMVAADAWTHSDWISLAVAAGTIGLAGITAFLAWKTRGMERATGRMAIATQEMVEATRDAIAAEDERLQRSLDAQETMRRRERAIGAALQIIESVEGSGVEPGLVDVGVIQQRSARVRARLWAQVGLLDDQGIENRVRSCMALLQLLHWTADNLAAKGLGYPVVALQVPGTLQALELSLQDYVAGREVKPWVGPPAIDFDGVIEWIRQRSGGGA